MSIQTPYNLRNEREEKFPTLKRIGLAAAAMIGIGAFSEHVAATYDRNSVRDAVAICTGYDTKGEIEACAKSALIKERGFLALQEPVGFLSGQTISDEIQAAVGRFFVRRDLLE